MKNKELINKKLVVYDGNCYLCRNGAILAAEYGFIPQSRLTAFDDLDEHLRSKVDLEKFRSEMAVIDLEKKETSYGVDGVLSILSIRMPFMGKVKKEGLIYRIFKVLYRMIAYNRYILFPFNSPYKCDCEPPLNRRYRVALIAFCIFFSVLISALLGLSVSKHFPIPVYTAVAATLFAVGTGWLLQMITALLFLKGEQVYNYLGNLGVIMLAGVLILIPGLAGAFLKTSVYLPLIAFFILVSCFTMTLMHRKRARILGLSSLWTWLWFIFLQLSFISTLIFILS